MIDSSPMYGSSQQVVGYALEQLDYPSQLFSAEKVWTRDGSVARRQIQQTGNAWGLKRFDLMQIHNLLSWQDHIEILKQMKSNGELRYIGITTSHGRRHRELEKIMASEPLDFVQLTYNLEDREVERRLLPLAREKGIAVIANRPFQGGSLINQLQRRNAPLPDFTKAINCQNWAQFLLKYVVSHPAITCAHSRDYSARAHAGKYGRR
ncbi:MAG: diketogulonate reductase-like aldo/keto reductase [Cellvibrionaceae bacterium]|jgi:diketogulonate reductase-like aldo/keto reductase